MHTMHTMHTMHGRVLEYNTSCIQTLWSRQSNARKDEKADLIILFITNPKMFSNFILNSVYAEYRKIIIAQV